MPLTKPASIEANSFKSAKWDELTKGRKFSDSDVPALTLLCEWYAIVDRCVEDMDDDGELRVAYMNAMDDIKAMPQIATLKQASSEIRALNKQLGICDTAEPETEAKETKLYVIQKAREDRSAKAAGGQGA